MIQNIQFENFRGFRKMTLSDLRPVTLISGKNNVGKSSILEGIFLFFDHISPDSFMKISQFRGGTFPLHTVSLWETFFYKMDADNPLRLSVTYNGENASLEYKKDNSYIPANDYNVPMDVMNQFISYAKSAYTLKFSYHKGQYSENGHFSIGTQGMIRNATSSLENNQFENFPLIRFINATVIMSDSTLIDWVGKLELQGNKDKIIEMLKYMDPSISDICTISMDGRVQLYIRSDKNLIPLKLAGDGVNKLLYIILAIIESPNSVILIDEVETGFHYSMYKNLWEVIGRVAQKCHCQIIATTHSYECIVGASEGMKQIGLSEDFCYYRIERNEQENIAYRFSNDILQTALSVDMEVR